MASVTLDEVTKIYPGGTTAVDHLRLRVEDGEIVVLLGPSGCGKSTVLRMIAGLEPINSGRLLLNDQYANDLSPGARDVAMVFQNSALYPHRSVKGNLAFPLEVARGNPAAINQRVIDLARALGIDEMLPRMPSTLSGGERQRVAMGRAIIREPQVFLLDEPLSNLDAGLRAELRMEIAQLIRSLGVTTVYVTHDQVEALTLADRIAVMRRGVLQDLGTPEQIYNDPATAFVAAFLSSPQINLMPASVWVGDEGYITLDFGGPVLRVPLIDPRAPGLLRNHGGGIILGARPDALSLVPEPMAGRALPGRIRALEYHGHEWLAHIEAGTTSVTMAEPADESPDHSKITENGLSVRRGWRALRSFARRGGVGGGAHQGGAHHADPVAPPLHTGTHRRTDIVVRLRSNQRWATGMLVGVAFDMSQVFLFDQNGERIDQIHR